MIALFDNLRLNDDNLVTKTVKVPASNMRDYGQFQRLVTTITVPSVRNDFQAVLKAAVVPDTVSSVSAMDIYQESVLDNSYQYVSLHEKGIPTYIDGVRADLRADKQMKGKRIAFTYKENGILVRGLNKGEMVRLYDLSGKEIFVKSAKGTELFVPVDRHAFFVLSADDESIKFLF